MPHYALSVRNKSCRKNSETVAACKSRSASLGVHKLQSSEHIRYPGRAHMNLRSAIRALLERGIIGQCYRAVIAAARVML
jgi:hypothetical protein